MGLYAAMSKTISLIIGPLGWVAAALGVAYKLGAPDMRKLTLVVLMIAAARNAPTATGLATS